VAAQAQAHGSRFEVVIYNVYGDESSDEKKERVFAVAGLIGDEIQWEEFKHRWVDPRHGASVRDHRE
jgi:hypothetical protein